MRIVWREEYLNEERLHHMALIAGQVTYMYDPPLKIYSKNSRANKFMHKWV